MKITALDLLVLTCLFSVNTDTLNRRTATLQKGARPQKPDDAGEPTSTDKPPLQPLSKVKPTTVPPVKPSLQEPIGRPSQLPVKSKPSAPPEYLKDPASTASPPTLPSAKKQPTVKSLFKPPNKKSSQKGERLTVRTRRKTTPQVHFIPMFDIN